MMLDKHAKLKYKYGNRHFRAEVCSRDAAVHLVLATRAISSMDLPSAVISSKISYILE